MKANYVAVPLAGLGLMLGHLGCAQLVGITDTEVAAAAPGGGGTGAGGGSGGSGSVSPGGSAGSGTGGSLAAGGSAGSELTGGVGGAAGSPGAGGADAGVSCGEGEGRCTESGRETCTSGAWQAAPCPPGQPSCEAGECIVRGPALVQVGNSFFVDATEVTMGQYAEFLAVKGADTSGQPSVCAFNTNYWDEEERGDISLQLPARPAAYVDWCDAAAYCAWADKHLCGRIGGGSVARSELFDRTVSQWFLACAGPGGGVQVNPNDGACNSSMGFEDVADVATFPECEGFYPGVFDLQGNVSEWVDSCEGATGNTDRCMSVGGNVTDYESFCDEVFDEYSRDTKAFTFGFRCCSG